MMLAWLLQALYSTALADILSLAWGHLTPTIAVLSLLIGAFFGYRHAKRFSSSNPEYKWMNFSSASSGTMEIVLFTFILYAGLRHFVWLFYRVDHGWSTLLPYNYGDLPLHINYIRSMANGIAFPPSNPGFASQALHYPFGPDLYNALFEIIGVRLQAHLAVVGIVALSASLVFLRAFGGWWAIGAFFLNGGFAGWDFASRGLWNSHQNIDWKNLFLTVFVTQRGMLFALPAGLFLLSSVQKHFSRERILNRPQMTVLGLVWAILPLFHLHSFVAVSILMLGYAVANAGAKGAREFFLSRMALIAYIPATYQVLASTEFLKKANVVKISWGWMAPENGFAHFMAINFGLWLLLPVVVAWAIFHEADKKRRRALGIEFVFNLFVFAVFFNVMLAPWAWDNIKVLIWPYLGIVRLAWVTLEPKFARGHLGYLRGVTAMLLFFSGFTFVLWSVQSPRATGAQIYHDSLLAEAEGALADVPKDAVFATAMTFDHVLTYFGRMRVVGYEGHVWSHGIDGTTTVAKLKELMKGEGDYRALVRDLGVQYIYWGPQEKAVFGTNEKPWMKAYKNVSRVPDQAIYKVTDSVQETTK